MSKKRKRRNRKKKRGPRPMKAGCLAAMEALPDAEILAGDHDIDIRIATPTSSGSMGPGRPTLHVMFEHDGCRLLNWWPATGTVMVPGEEKTKLPDLQAALDLAIQLRNTLSPAGWF